MKRLFILILLFFSALSNSQGSAQLNFDDAFAVRVDSDNLRGAVDFSYLNQPLKESDRVFVCGAHFCTLGSDLKSGTSDDKRVVFFGVNFGAKASFPETGDAPRIAKRLRKLGVNIVRLHYLDVEPDAKSPQFSSILLKRPFPALDPAAVGRLKYFIDCLALEGIYVDLNLHVAYKFSPERDGVPVGTIPEQSKPLIHFDESMIQMQIRYLSALIDGLALKKSSSLAMVEISNESSLAHSWLIASRTTTGLDETFPPAYKNQLERLWNKEYPNEPFDLSPSKIVQKQRLIKFFEKIDAIYFNRIKKAVRDKIGYAIPVSGTQNLYGGLSIIRAQADMDFYDNHFYHDHYEFGKAKRVEDGTSWSIKNDDVVSDQNFRALANLALLRGLDKPYTVSEYGSPWPNSSGHQQIPLMASVGVLQDWDALIYYEYSKDRDWDSSSINFFNLKGDPARLAVFGQSALAFRSREKASDSKGVRVDVDDDQILRQFASGMSGWRTLEFLSKNSKLNDVSALRYVGVGAVSTKSGVTEVKVDGFGSGRMVNEDSAYIFSSAKMIAFLGKLKPNQSVSAGDFSFSNRINQPQALSIVITCANGTPIAGCRDYLISNPGATMGVDGVIDSQKIMGVFGERSVSSSKMSGRISQGQTPFNAIASKGGLFMQRSKIVLALRSSSKSASLILLDELGGSLSNIDKNSTENGFEFSLGVEASRSPWYRLVLAN